MAVKNKVLSVDLGDRSYDVVVGKGLLDQVVELIKPVLPSSKVVVVTDDVVAIYHLKALKDALAYSDIVSHTVTLEAGESTKDFKNLEKLLNLFSEIGVERNTTLIALGGGVIGDLTGFAASIYLRGVPFIQIPTTLLAQVDSAVGGKTAINTSFGKNLVGTFYQPRLVLADTSVLSSLPEREYISGYAEIAKYGIIADKKFFEWLEDNEANIKARDEKTLQQMVLKSCKTKAKIVAKDEREAGMRAILNFGHTFAHALEREVGYDSKVLLHGEAVSLGMVMAMRLSVKLGLVGDEAVGRVGVHLQNVGLPVSLEQVRDYWSVSELMSHMQKDKKVSDGKLVFIVAKTIGKAVVDKTVDEGLVLEVLEEACL